MRRALRPRERDARPSSGSAHALTPGPRRPAGPASLSRFLRFRLPRLPRFAATASACALAAAFVLLPGAGEVQAQTEVKLVGNTGVGSNLFSQGSVSRAQTFFTGSAAHGYVLTAVDIVAEGLDLRVTVRIATSDSSNKPDDTLGTLTKGAFSSSGLLRFTSSEGIVLEPGTTYIVALNGTNGNHRYLRTNADGEDSGAAAGWSIGNGSRWGNNYNSTSSSSLKMAIHGYERPPPIEPTDLVPGVLQSFPASDLFDGTDADTTYTFAATSDDLADPGAIWATSAQGDFPFAFNQRLYFQTKRSHELAALSPKPPNPFVVDVAVTASAGGTRTVPFRTAYVDDTTPAQATGASVSNDGLAVTVTFDDPMRARSVPFGGTAEDGFVVGPAAGGAYAIASGAVSAAAPQLVVLTLTSAVPQGAAVRVSYDPASVGERSRLENAAGNPVAAFELTGDDVANLTGADSTAPTAVQARFVGDRLTVAFDEELAPYLPHAEDFAVRWQVYDADGYHQFLDNGDPYIASLGVAAAALDGGTVTLTLDAPLADSTLNVDVAYTPTSEGGSPRPGSLRDHAGNHVAGFAAALPALYSPAPARHGDPLFTGPVPESAGTVDPSGSGFSYHVPLPDATGGTGELRYYLSAGPVEAGRAFRLPAGLEYVQGAKATIHDFRLAVHPPMVPRGVYALRYVVVDRDQRRDTLEFEMRAGVPPGHDPTPALAQAFVTDGTDGTLALVFDRKLDGDTVPAADRFTVTVDGAAADVASVSVSGSTVFLTLADPVPDGARVTARYAPPGSGDGILSADWHPAAGFPDVPLPYERPSGPSAPPSPPGLADAFVREAALTLLYGTELGPGSVPAPGAFTVRVNGAVRDLATEDLNADPPVAPVAVRDRRVVLTLASPVGASDSVRLTYEAGANPIQDALGTPAAGLSNRSVRNLAGDARGPELRGAWVQGAVLTLVYDEPLDPDGTAAPASFNVREIHGNGANRIAVTAIEVSGRRVVLTLERAVNPERLVELSYNSSGGDRPDSPAVIQDYAGNLADGIFSPLTVAHGAPPPDRPAAPPPSGGGPGDGGGGGEAPEPRNATPEASGAVGALTLGTGGSAEVDLSARFTDPDGDALDFAAESSNPAVAAVEVDGETLTVTGVGPGTAEVTVTAEDPDRASATQSFTVTVTGVERVWHLPPASDPVLQGFVRVINHSDHAGEATITATDDAGRSYGPLTLALGRRGAAHFNVHDLEMGNPAKGLTGATGPGTGGWRLAVESESLAVEALAYARAADGFLTPLDGTAPRAADGALELATFNPGSNWRQVSLLRLVNPTDADAEAAVAGADDAGRPPAAPVRLTVPAGTACTVDAAELESGDGLACGDPQAGLGDGTGKWRLRIESEAPLVAMGLLRSPTGHLSNLSAGALPAGADGVRRVHMFPSASDPDGRQGFVRFISRSDRDGTVTVRASDGTDADYEALTLALPAGQAAQFNSDDLELGNPDKGLTGSTGPGRGDWTLALSGEVEFDAYAYVRSRRDGFLAPMGASAPSRDVDGASVSRVAFLNPGGNWRQRSVLRLVNPGAEDAQASIEGTDDMGLRPGSPVRVTVPAGGSVELASAELESGDAQSIETGALGDGGGKWRLRIESDRPVAALSLATSPTGRLVNLSGADADRGFRHGLLPPPGGVTLESPYECELLGRWDAAPGAPHAVDLLRDGERLAAHSAARWTHPTRRWAGLCEGTYAIRVCALNADGDCGPWSAESNAVAVD